MNLKNSRALTLVEGLVSILLLGAFVSSFLGAFVVSRLSTQRAQHKVAAMNIARQYLEREVRAGYSGGADDDGDYYMTLHSDNPTVIMPTATVTVDNKVYTVTPDPYFPNNIEDPNTHVVLSYENTHYKIVGFIVTWRENTFGGGSGPVCSERILAYLFDHGQ